MNNEEIHKEFKDFIEKTTYENWYYVSGTRDVGKSYISNLLEEKDKEIERLKDVIKNKHLKEIERLNNIIKRLEEFIEKEIELYTLELTEKNTNALSYSLPIRGVYKEIYNVLQELKGSDKE